MKKLIRKINYFILLLLLIPTLSFAADIDYKVTDDGTIHGYDLITKGPWVDSRAYTTLEDANTAAYNAGKLLVITKNYTLTANTTLTAAVKVIKGGGLTKASTYTLAINGPFEAGLYQVFIGFSAGDVTFGSGAVKKFYPEWWKTNETPGATDMRAAIQAAVDASVIAHVPVLLQGTTYALSDGISHKTGDEWYTGTPPFPQNGVQIIGNGRNNTVLKAIAGFPNASSMINLDGNKDASEDNLHPRGQLYNKLEGFRLDGNNIACRGLRLRANVYGTYKDLEFHSFVGNISDAAIIIVGVTTPGKDDADSTHGCIFDSVNIYKSTGWGVYGVSNRVSSLHFKNCSIRYCTYDGMRMSFAGLILEGCTFASNGSFGDNTTGGFSAIKSATGARNRGLVISGGMFEANYWHEINIDYCYGYSINGAVFHPYQKSAEATGQNTIRVGGVGAYAGSISNIRIQEYSIPYGYNITGVAVAANTDDLNLSSITFGHATGHLSIHSSSTRIIYNGYAISATHIIPSFSVSTITHATPIGNVTGDGTEYTSVELVVASTMEVRFNNGGKYANGAFTAPYAGFYTFTALWPICGTLSTHTNTKVYVKVGSTTYLVASNFHGDISAATFTLFGGSIQLKLAAGDVVTTSIVVSGGTKTVDIYRNTTPAPFIFCGFGF